MEQLWKKRRSENLVARSTVEGRKAGSLARVIDLALVCAPGKRNLHTGTNDSTLCAKSKVSYVLHFFTLHSPSWSPGGPPRLPTEQVEVGDTLRSLSSDLACCALQMERWVFTQRQHNASPKMFIHTLLTRYLTGIQNLLFEAKPGVAKTEIMVNVGSVSRCVLKPAGQELVLRLVFRATISLDN